MGGFSRASALILAGIFKCLSQSLVKYIGAVKDNTNIVVELFPLEFLL